MTTNDTPTVLITGATTGLGRALASELALRDWNVAAHGRDPGRLRALRTGIEGHGGTVTTYTADITEPARVATMCAEVRADHGTLDLVINNAAVGGGAEPTRREVNSRGTELRMAGNYLAPYLINRELTDALASSRRGGRIVNVASAGQAPLDVEDLDFERGYEGVEAYCRSKLAMIMDTIDLGERLRPAGVTVNAVHPAHLMPTTMVADSGFTPESTVDDGVLAVLRLALDTDLREVTGAYLDRFSVAEPHAQARDVSVRRRLAAWASERVAVRVDTVT